MEGEGKQQNKKRRISSSISKKNKTKSSNALQAFNFLGAFAYLNLSTMEKNKPYRITDSMRRGTKYGDRLMVQLDGTSTLFLPERYNTFPDRLVAELGTGKYVLLNRGMQGKSYKLELLRAGVSLSSEFPNPQPQPATATAVIHLPECSKVEVVFYRCGR